MKLGPFLVILSLAIGGCASHKWMPGPGTGGDQ